jgi:hypothetical protein
MSNQTLDDIQVTIDALFEKLEQAETGSDLTQCNHALRIQITKKKQLGGKLTEREAAIIVAMGVILAKKSGMVMQIIVGIITFFIGLYVAYKLFS